MDILMENATKLTGLISDLREAPSSAGLINVLISVSHPEQVAQPRKLPGVEANCKTQDLQIVEVPVRGRQSSCHHQSVTVLFSVF